MTGRAGARAVRPWSHWARSSTSTSAARSFPTYPRTSLGWSTRAPPPTRRRARQRLRDPPPARGRGLRPAASSTRAGTGVATLRHGRGEGLTTQQPDDDEACSATSRRGRRRRARKGASRRRSPRARGAPPAHPRLVDHDHPRGRRGGRHAWATFQASQWEGPSPDAQSARRSCARTPPQTTAATQQTIIDSQTWL